MQSSCRGETGSSLFPCVSSQCLSSFVCLLPAGIAGRTEIAIIERFGSVLRLGDDVGIADVVRPYGFQRDLVDLSLVVKGAYGTSAKAADKALFLQ